MFTYLYHRMFCPWLALSWLVILTFKPKLHTGMWFQHTVNLQYICTPFALFSSPQHAAWWLAGYSRHLQSRWCRSRAPFPFLYNSLAKYWVGQSAEPRISFLQKYEMCFPSTSAILSWFPSGASVNLIPSLCMLAYTLLSYHITHLLMWARHKLAYRDISEIWCHIQCCSLPIAYCYAYFVGVLL